MANVKVSDQVLMDWVFANIFSVTDFWVYSVLFESKVIFNADKFWNGIDTSHHKSAFQWTNARSKHV